MTEVSVVERVGLWRSFLATPWPAPIAVLPLLPALMVAHAFVVPTAFTWACLFTMLVWARRSAFHVAPVLATTAKVTKRELVLRGRPAIPRSRLRLGYLRHATAPGGKPVHVVVLRTDDTETLLQCPDAAAGGRLLTALALDRAATRHHGAITTVALSGLAWPTHAVMWALGLSALTALGYAAFAGLRAPELFALRCAMYGLGVVALATAAYGTARNSARHWKGKTIHVGADGFCIESPAGSRFIPFGEIVELKPELWSSVVILQSSETLRLFGPAQDGASVCLRVARALERYRARAKSPARAHELAITSSSDAYRSQATTADDALAVLEDPAAADEERVAAATWLARAPDRREAASRLRVVADETASPLVRIAIDAVGAEEEADDLAPAAQARHAR